MEPRMATQGMELALALVHRECKLLLETFLSKISSEITYKNHDFHLIKSSRTSFFRKFKGN